ncbi:hypothetical protein LTS08_005714 [Lithohypha guttulata]|nr:hypothetical protein LTS08_005714 [Lithohypha guttulata]
MTAMTHSDDVKGHATTAKAYELLGPRSTSPSQHEDTTSHHHHHHDHVMSHLPTKRSGGWLWEGLSFSVALACFAAIIGLLISLREHKTPNWPSGLSVNAVLSVLVTVMKGAMGICITECLSQIKWTWFKRERKLIDLAIIDDASRGAWGAGRLLLTFRSWYLAYLGALVFFAAFVIGPSVQQLVETRIRQVDVPTNANVPVCNNTYYDVVGLGSGSGLNRVNLPMIGSMYDGFLQTSSQSPLRPNCPSGNCTYPRYQSLGVCHECSDHSSQLLYVDKSTNLTYPTSVESNCSKQLSTCDLQWIGAGLSLQSNYGMVNSTQATSSKLDPALAATDNTTFSTFHAILAHNWQANSNPEPAPSAVKCDLRLCVKTYEGSVSGGQFRENTISTTWNGSYLDGATQLNYHTFQNYVVIPARPCYINGSEILEPWNDVDRDRCTYNISSAAVIALGNTVEGLTKGYGSAITSNRPALSSDVMQALYGIFNSTSLEDPDIGTLASVQRAFKSMADVVTNQARGSLVNCGGATAPGTQFIDELYIHVRWVWLLPTITVLVLCLVFFLATIVQSWSDDLWKSSPLAHIFVRPILTDTVLTSKVFSAERGLGARPKMDTIEKESRYVKVRYERDIGTFRAG